jgi:hypothetical protein
MNARNTVLMYAEQDGWKLDADYVDSIDLARDGMVVFIQFTRTGQVSSASCYRPYFNIRHNQANKLQALLNWLRNGWKEPNVPATETPVTETIANDFQVRTALSSLYEIAQQSVDKTWGTPETLLGPVLYRALLAEELLHLIGAHAKAPGTEDATVRFMAQGLWDRLVERHPCT